MINILPDKIKKEIKYLFVYKKVIIILTFFVVSLLLFTAFLYFLEGLLIEKTYFFQEMVDDKQKKMETTQLKDFRDLIQEENRQLGNVGRIFEGNIYIYTAFEKIFGLIPNEIYIKKINVRKTETFLERGVKNSVDKSVKVELSGFCLDRESLISFLEILKSDDSLQDIEISKSFLLKQDNIDFSVSFKLASF